MFHTTTAVVTDGGEEKRPASSFGTRVQLFLSAFLLAQYALILAAAAFRCAADHPRRPRFLECSLLLLAWDWEARVLASPLRLPPGRAQRRSGKAE